MVTSVGQGGSGSETGEAAATVVFVCPHGALKSRLAAAYFNRVAPPDRRATSAGLHPQEAVSTHAVALVAGSEVAGLLDTGPPRPLDDAPGARLVVTIDCELPDAVTWWLDRPETGEPMRDELRQRAEGLAAELGRSPAPPEAGH